ncbi:MAG: DoxX family protein [bacterium]
MKNISTISAWFRNQNAGLLVLRLAVAIPFIVHGYAKLHAHGDFVTIFTQIGIVAPAFMAWFVGLVEFVGGILVLLGIFVRTASALLAIVMIVAIATYHGKLGYAIMGNGYEYALTLALASLALVFTGAGEYVPARLAKLEAKCCAACSKCCGGSCEGSACGCEETK